MDVNRNQNAFHGARSFFTWSLLLFTLLLGLPAVSQAAVPAVFYSDLESGPNIGGENNKGVFVTISGKNFGVTRGTSFVTIGGGQADNYPLWTDTKIVFQLGAGATSGNIAVTTGTGQSTNNIPFTVRAGRIFFVTPSGSGNGSLASPMSPRSAYLGLQPGDTYYYRSGTYSDNYGDTNWSTANFNLGPSKSGTAGNPVAFIGYPNETATFQSPGGTGGGNFNMRDSSDTSASYFGIANLRLAGGDDCISGGGVTIGGGEVAKSGAYGMRVVGNILSGSYSNGSNTMTGLISVHNDANRILGNEFKDTGTTPPINNNHIIYVQLGSSDVEIAWNYLHDVRVGHVIQVHTDKYFLYTNVRIHDNTIAKGATGDSRAINIGNALAGTYGAIYNNIIDSVGQDFSGIMLYSGDWKVYNNTLYKVYASTGIVILSNLPRQLNGGSGPTGWNPPTADIKNNIIYSDGGSVYVGVTSGATMSQVTLSNNLYYNFGAAPNQDLSAVTGDPLFVNPLTGDFKLQTGSPGRDRGTSSVNTVVTMDHDGVGRPQGGIFDIGAFESAGPSLPKPQNLTVYHQ